METHDEKMSRLHEEFFATAKGTKEYEEKLLELLDAMEEIEVEPGSLHMTVCAGARSYEDVADTFNEVATIAYDKLLEWMAADPELDMVTVTTWERDGEGEEMCELLVRRDATFTFTYAPFPFLENNIEKIGL